LPPNSELKKKASLLIKPSISEDNNMSNYSSSAARFGLKSNKINVGHQRNSNGN